MSMFYFLGYLDVVTLSGAVLTDYRRKIVSSVASSVDTDLLYPVL